MVKLLSSEGQFYARSPDTAADGEVVIIGEVFIKKCCPHRHKGVGILAKVLGDDEVRRAVGVILPIAVEIILYHWL